ncbi:MULTISPECIES: rSAM-modified peptide [Flavobacterium]|uniref:RSAM-modified peptide n=1 Tax=Flavobacterium lipolyticum TaxID=2893754 RepID=A0ABS8M1H9_9FLAO|nr:MULTISPECIES: rSAM-modified peptide [unclassified Flavobacterium]MCC9018038.1 rSAM-modified peptide [Flavobacterium sp. F-126]
MANRAQKFEDFQSEKLSKKEQKTVQGGDESIIPGDPSRGNGKGSN